MKADKITVVGLGLIGASVCRAAKKYGASVEVVGIDPDASVREYALQNGIVDICQEDVKVKNDSSLVVVATYVDSIADTVGDIATHLEKGSIITDVGSVKSDVVDSVEKNLSDEISFIGSHPIAGSENPGIRNSDPDLFRDCNVVITPTQKTKDEAIDTVSNFWKKLGSKVIKMEPGLHDRIFAYVSHLPHVVAYSLVNSLDSSDIEDIFSYSGGGLRDYTRIASSSPEMWKTIFVQNRESVLESIKNFKQNLELIESAIKNDDLKSLQALLENARDKKDSSH